jgi:hypothetical protein
MVQYIGCLFACTHNSLSSHLPLGCACNLLPPHLPGVWWGRWGMQWGQGAAELIEGSKQLAWQESNCMQERVTCMVERWSRARGWQWQGRLLQGVVVVASQGILPQEGHQVAKLEHTDVSSKLQHDLPALLHLILDAFIVPRLEYLII